MQKLYIPFEDNHVIVVDKPVNIAVQADDSGDMDLQTMLKDHIAHKYNKPGNVYLGIVHRLDRPVSGLMVFARTSKGASRLSDSIRRYEMDKIYHAIVQGKTPDKGTLVHWLVKDAAQNMVKAHDKAVKDSKEAILHFECVAFSEGLSLLKIDLETGRPHQIRVQCKAMGHPIWGDQRYNENAKVGQQIALRATSLSFPHPTTKERLKFTIELPNSQPWGKLKR